MRRVWGPMQIAYCKLKESALSTFEDPLAPMGTKNLPDKRLLLLCAARLVAQFGYGHPLNSEYSDAGEQKLLRAASVALFGGWTEYQFRGCELIVQSN